MAADILLRQKPSQESFESLFQIMASQDTKELNTLLLGRIRDLASSDNHIQQVKRIARYYDELFVVIQ